MKIIHQSPFTVDQVFMKIPLRGCAKAKHFTGPLIKGVGILSADAFFRGHGKGHAVVKFTKSGNLFGAAWLLLAKIIAGHPDDDKTPIFIMIIKRF